jgi:DNA-binding MarR family transcriptional regulator
MKEKDLNLSNCLYFSTNSLSRILTRMADEEFAVTGLSSSYAFLLMIVINNPGIQPKYISRQILLSQSTITRLIEKMELRKLLKRKVVGRNTEVYPTKAAIRLEPSIKQAWRNLNLRYTNIMGSKQAESLTTAIYLSTALLSE